MNVMDQITKDIRAHAAATLAHAGATPALTPLAELQAHLSKIRKALDTAEDLPVSKIMPLFDELAAEAWRAEQAAAKLAPKPTVDFWQPDAPVVAQVEG